MCVYMYSAPYVCVYGLFTRCNVYNTNIHTHSLLRAYTSVYIFLFQIYVSLATNYTIICFYLFSALYGKLEQNFVSVNNLNAELLFSYNLYTWFYGFITTNFRIFKSFNGLYVGTKKVFEFLWFSNAKYFIVEHHKITTNIIHHYMNIQMVFDRI